MASLRSQITDLPNFVTSTVLLYLSLVVSLASGVEFPRAFAKAVGAAKRESPSKV